MSSLKAVLTAIVLVIAIIAFAVVVVNFQNTEHTYEIACLEDGGRIIEGLCEVVDTTE